MMSFFLGGAFEAIFIIMFIMVAAVFVVAFVSGITRWNKNNRSPRLTVSAVVVAKRTDITHHHHANAGDTTGMHGYNYTSDMSYYVTFQVESGDRMELALNGTEYGLLVEGDSGWLSFQGTRYLGFERT